MAKYVDGYVLVIPKKNLVAYKKMATDAGKIWKKYGALDYKECIGDDLSPDTGKETIAYFPKIMKAKNDEVIVFSYIVFKSRAHRDKVNALVMKDSSMDTPEYRDKPMPFDMKRMAYGGFIPIVDL